MHNLKLMKSKHFFSFLLLFTIVVQGCYSQTSSSKKNINMDTSNQKKNPMYSNTDTSKVVMSDDEWKKMLSPEVYYVARQKGYGFFDRRFHHGR